MASPQTRIIEYDLSGRVDRYQGMYGLIIGAFDRGPVNQRFWVDNSQTLDRMCGAPKVGSDISYYIGHTFLSKSSRCWMYRVMGNGGLYGGVSIGASYHTVMGMSDGTTQDYFGVLRFNRAHPGTVSVYVDNMRIGFDDSNGKIKGTNISGEVNYFNGEVYVHLENPLPAGATLNVRHGQPNVAFTSGMPEPEVYDFDGRVVRQILSPAVGKNVQDILVPTNLVVPKFPVTSAALASVRIFDGDKLVAYAKENGDIISSSGQFVLGSIVEYYSGELHLEFSSDYTPSGVLSAEYRSYNTEACIFAADNPGEWARDYSILIANVSLETYKFDLTIFERDSREVNNRVEAYILSRTHIKDAQERDMHIESRLNGKNYYIRAKDNPYLNDTECLVTESSVHNSFTARVATQLSGGHNGMAPTVMHYINALNTFSNKEDIKIDVVMDTLGDPNYQLAIAKLCDRELGGRGDCYGITHMPFDIEERTTFINDMVNYRKYTLNIGSSFMGMYAGHVKIYDGYVGREIWIPPTGFVGAAFSYTADTFEPWFPAAGWKRGVLPVLDVYRRFSLGERDILYDNDINPIRFRPGKGVAIWGQKTMYGRASALDRANVRWLLIVIQSAIEEYLDDNAVFELNDSSTRSILSATISDYLQSIQNRRGLYSFEVVSDETNNTPETIDNYELFVDFYVQPTKAAEYVFGRCVITRTGVNFDDVRLSA